MKSKSIVVTILLCAISFVLQAQIEIKFGNSAGQAGYYNQNSHPGVEEPYPIGPLAFRVAGSDIWVADSIGAKLIKMDKEKGFTSELALVASPAEMLIEDFALVKDVESNVTGFWVIDAINNAVISYSTDGRKTGQLDFDKFVQPFRIEVGRSGHIFVGDKGAQAIFAFTPNGEYIGESNWEWSGFAVAGPDDSLYRLFYASEDGKTFMVSQNLAGEILREVELALPEHMNPELWWVNDDKGQAVLTFTPATGFEGTFVLATVDFDGEVKSMAEIKPPFVMNRFIDSDKNEVWSGTADYTTAPEGCLSLNRFPMP